MFAALLKPRPHRLLQALINGAAAAGPLHALQIGAVTESGAIPATVNASV